MTTVDNSGVYVYYLKGMCLYILDAQLGLWVSLNKLHCCCDNTVILPLTFCVGENDFDRNYRGT